MRMCYVDRLHVVARLCTVDINMECECQLLRVTFFSCKSLAGWRGVCLQVYKKTIYFKYLERLCGDRSIFCLPLCFAHLTAPTFLADMEMTQRLKPSSSFSSGLSRSTSATQTCSNGTSISTQTLDSIGRELDPGDVQL